jgi:hypothetical protein
MKKAKPHINSLSTAKKLAVGDMVRYDVWLSDAFPEDNAGTTQPEHGLVIEVSIGSIVKVRPLQNFNTIRLLNTADCTLIKKEDA